MKQYAKVVEAEQFNGDMASMTEFIGPDSTFILNEDKYTLTTPTDKWNVVLGDYVAKGYERINVFKASRFEAEFEEITIEDAAPIQTLQGGVGYTTLASEFTGSHSTAIGTQPIEIKEPVVEGTEALPKKSKFKKDQE